MKYILFKTLLLITILSLIAGGVSVYVYGNNKQKDGQPQTACKGCEHDTADSNTKANASPKEPDEHAEHGAAEAQDHDGHDHADEQDEHDGHDHADEQDEHDGHDHADEQDEHDGHDHADEQDEHDGHDHGDANSDEHEGHEDGIALTEDQRKEIGLSLEKAGPGSLKKELSLTGEVVLNEDTVVHLVPRVPGIAVKVNYSLGDKVRKGDVLAVLDSAELGEAKSEYYERFNEVGCCLIDLERAQTLERNTRKAVKDLKALPNLDELRKYDYGDMGEYRSKLLASYAEFLNSRKNYERSKTLFAKKVVSESSYLDQRNDYEKAQAEFFSKLHDTEFAIRQDLYEKERTQRVNKFKLKTAERKLRILGLTNDQIKALQDDLSPAEPACKPGECKGCKRCSAKAKQAEKEEYSSDDDDFCRIEIVAPDNGTITSKHITRGEKIDDETEIFTIADLDTVWVNLRVPIRDLPLIREGSKVIVRSTVGMKAEGTVSLISPVIDEETRTATARVVLNNPGNLWKPGSFVTGYLSLSAKNVPLVVPRHSVQNIDGKDFIFVKNGNGFKPVPVVTGRSDRDHIEIVAGLKAGTTYVSKGAFELKAIKITSNLDSHAGHGH